MLIVNARVYTMDATHTVAEAVATDTSGQIAAVGGTSELRAAFPREVTIDASGRALLPGLIDAHAHLSNLARGALGLTVTGAPSEEAIAARVAERIASLRTGAWLVGRGWDQNLWPAARFPDRRSLDGAAPAHPVALTRIDGHATWANSAALRAAGITRDSDDPIGGRILRDESGEPAGVLIDTAQRLLRDVIPAPDDGAMLPAIRQAIDSCLRAGLTEVHEMGLDLHTIALYQRLIECGQFPFRVYGAVAGRGETWDAVRARGPLLDGGDQRLTVRALKLLSDGALGSRGAALLEPYSDDADNRGLLILSEDEIADLCDQALDAGFQVCTHAIGDRANRTVLNAYERALARRPAGDYRFRVEHAQILSEADVPRFRALGVLPSMQATHCTSDMPWAPQRLGEARLRYAYAWRTMLDSGVPLLGGSDFPVESPNPLLGIYASVTRQALDGNPAEGWNAAERMTRLEAVRSFTSWAAYGAFEEGRRGVIAAGADADLVLFTADPFAVPAAEIPAIEPLLTLVGGEIVFDAHKL